MSERRPRPDPLPHQEKIAAYLGIRPRQVMMLDLLVSGICSKQVAEMLGTTYLSFKVTLFRLRESLGIGSTLELAIWYIWMTQIVPRSAVIGALVRKDNTV